MEGEHFWGNYDLMNVLGTYPPIANLTEKLPNNENVDAYVVFYPVPAPIGGALRGFGLLRAAVFSTSTVVYGIYNMAVIDAHTHKEIARTDGFVNEVIDNSAWPTRLMPTEDQKAQFKRAAQAGLEKQIEPELRRVKLLP